MSVSASDAAGNSSLQSSPLSVTTLNGGGGGPTVLSASYFESGWDDWNDGGTNNNRASNSNHAWEGTRTNRIRNGSTSSLTTSDPFDLSSYSSVEISFYFKPVGMDNGEYFELQYNDGTGFVTVQTWTRGSDFNNNAFYSATEVLTSSSYNLASNGTFRFRNFGNQNNDRIFLDAIIITGISGGTNSISNVVEAQRDKQDLGTEVKAQEMELHLYPNPAKDILHFEAPQAISEVSVVSLAGQIVMHQKGDSQSLDLSHVSNGIYLLTVRTEGGQTLRKKFIKQ